MKQRYRYKSPFNFLDPFEIKDRDVFFGRDDEVNLVFNHFKKTNLVVIYGPTGSGKSSVALCGIANRFYEWEAVVVRKDMDYVESLFDKIEIELKVLKSNLDEAASDKFEADLNALIDKKLPDLRQLFEQINGLHTETNSIKTEIRRIIKLDRKQHKSQGQKKDNDSINDLQNQIREKDKQISEQVTKFLELLNTIFTRFDFTPLYILDQFEELFISGTKEEVSKFSLLLSLITIDVDLVNVVICIQTDYLGNLFEFETLNPSILHYKCHVDDPDDERVREILRGSFNQFNINRSLSLEEGDQRIDQIIKMLKSDGRVHLPFLQIYLNNLYIEDFLRTDDYKDSAQLLINPQTIDFNKFPLTFEEKEISSYGGIEKILSNYLNDISHSLIERDNEIYQDGHRDTVIKFLKNFITENNTKLSVDYIYRKRSSGQERYYLKSKKIVSSITGDIWGDHRLNRKESISDIIEELLRARILKTRERKYLEISHNLIAKIISEITVDKDIYKYYKSQFESLYDRYRAQLEINRKSEESSDLENIEFLSETFIKNVRENVDKIILKNDQNKRKKFNYWELSVAKADEEYARRKSARSRNKIAIVILSLSIIVAVISIIIANRTEIENTYMADLVNKRTSYLKKLLEKDSVRIDYSNRINEIIKNNSTNLTDYFRQFENINNEIRQNDNIDQEDIPILNEFYLNVLNNYTLNPFYLKEIQLPSEGTKVLSTKSIVRRNSQSEILMFLKNENNLFSKSIKLDKEVVTNTWDSLYSNAVADKVGYNPITSYEPYYDNNVRILYSNSNGMFVVNHELDIENRIFSKYDVSIKSLSAIEHMEDLNFVAVSKDKSLIYRIVIKSGIDPIPISKDLSYLIGNFSNKEVDIKIEDIPTIKGISRINSQEICYLATYHDSIPFLIKQNIYNDDKLLECFDARDLISYSDNEEFRDIQVDSCSNKLLLASNRFIYSFDLDKKFDTIIGSHIPQIVSKHNAKINSISSCYNEIMVGSDDRSASLYFDGNLEKPGDEILTNELIGHSEAIKNVSLLRLTNELFALTTGADNKILLWNLSPAHEEQYNIPDGHKIVELKYNNALYAGYFFKTRPKGHILKFNNGLNSNPQRLNYRWTFQNIEMRSHLTTLDLLDSVTIYVGTYWDGNIGQINNQGYKGRLRPKTNNGDKEITIIDLKIHGENMGIATDKGMFLLLGFQNDSPEYLINSNLRSIKFNSVDMHPSNNLLIGGTDNGTIYLWNPQSDDFQIYFGHSGKVNDVRFSKDGNYFISCSDDNTAIVWKTRPDFKSKGDHIGAENIYENTEKIIRHRSDIEDIQISKNNLIATAGNDKTVRLHKITERNDEIYLVPQLSIIKHNYEICSVVFGESDNIIYTADVMGIIKKWDTDNFADVIDKRTAN